MSDLTDAVHALDESHLFCRDLGHLWARVAHHARVVEWANSNTPIVERIMQCQTCGTKRIEQVRRRDGEMIRRNYKYPEGYRFPPGVAGKGGMAKAPFRREWIKRVVDEEQA